MDIFEFLQYGFIQRAVIAGSFIALLCSTLGVMLVLRRLSLIGDGLAHVTFGSVALGLLLRVYPLYASIPLVILGSLGVLRLMERAKLYGDAAIGLVSSLGIAGGVILASVAGGFNVDLFSYLFGNILAISESEVIIAIILSLTVLLVISLYYNELFSLTFDEEFAKTSGINTEKLNTIVIILAAVTVVLTMRVVGIMLTSALLIIPAVTALQLARSFRTAMVIASVTSVLSVISGIGISFAFDLPTGAVIVIVNFIFFTVAYGYKKVRLSD
ncbi:MAG: metal ABC transporter permease [Nitrospirota bacterium]